MTMDVDKPMIELCAVSMLPSTHFVQLAVFLSIAYIHMIDVSDDEGVDPGIDSSLSLIH